MTPRKPHNPITRAAVEIAFILFLFYANLLMGEYTRHNHLHRIGSLLVALRDVVTLENFGIGLAAAIIGYVTFEYLRAHS